MSDATWKPKKTYRRVSSDAGCWLLLSGMLIGPNVLAQSGGLEEITVTAQKREQSIQDVGIAITAFTGEQVRELGFGQSFDVARMTPGVHISGNNAGQTVQFTIRGVNQNDFNDQTEAPIAVYIDEGYVAFGQGQAFSLFDIDRIEILKGPQGTLFGRNATGGLVHYVTRKPSREIDAFAEVTYGSYNQVRFEGAVGGPLTETLAGRLAVMYSRHDDILENDYPDHFATLTGVPIDIGGEDLYDDDTAGVRGHLLFQPTDDIEALITVAHSRSRLSSPPYLERGAVPVFDAAGRQIDAFIASPSETREAVGPGGIAVDGPFSFDADTVRPAGGNWYGPSCSEANLEDLECSMDFAFDDTTKLDTTGASGKVVWTLPMFTLTSVTDYKHFRKEMITKADGGAATTLSVPFDSRSDTFTQELRLNGQNERTRWVAGFYYLKVDSDPRVALSADPTSFFTLLTGGVPFDNVALSELQTDSYSVFGQLEFDLTAQLTFIAGLRTIWEDKDFEAEETLFLNLDRQKLDREVALFSFRPRKSFRQSDTLWSGKLQMDWKPNEDWLLYAGINRGVKAGGFNNPFTFGAPFPDSDVPYGEEVLWAYEAGFKIDVLGGRGRFNGSFYYYDYDDYQGFIFDAGTGFVRNVDAKYKGLEVEAFLRPTPNWDVAVGLSYLDAKVSDVQIERGIFRDTEPSFSPDVQVSGLARYRWPRSVFRGEISLQADFNYVSKFWDNLRNFQASKVPEYVVGNARVGWKSDNQQLEMAFFVNNISDASYTIISFDTSALFGANSFYQGKPRWFGVSVRYDFF